MELARGFLHDFSGFALFFFGLAIFIFEVHILNNIFGRPEPPVPSPS